MYQEWIPGDTQMGHSLELESEETETVETAMEEELEAHSGERDFHFISSKKKRR